MMGTLYLVATPIGNLEDITLRALRVLREVRLIAAEDTRHTRKLLSHFDISTPTISYHEHSPPARRAEIVSSLAEGDVAVVTDAGTPGISDPGHDLVRDAIAAGYSVVSIPGPVAAIAALIASGLPADQFTFLGFLPRKPAERRAALEAVRAEPRTLVLYEAPHRLLSSLDDLISVLGDRGCAVARELTKLHEDWLRGTLSSVRERSASGTGPRGEYTVVVAGAPVGSTPALNSAETGDANIRERLSALLAGGMRTRDAAALVSSETGRPKREVYQLALEAQAVGDRDDRI